MPINRALMSKLKRQYGDKKGASVYYAMEQMGKVSPAKPKHPKRKRKRGK